MASKHGSRKSRHHVPKLSEESREAFALMGLALRVVQETEYYLAQAIVLGVSDRERARPVTIQQYLTERERMTLGQLVAKLKEAWVLEPELENLLDAFVEKRNLLVHGLTNKHGFDPDTKIGANRVRHWISIFLPLAFQVHKLMRGGWAFSVEFAKQEVMKSGAKIPAMECPEELLDEVRSFLMLATPRGSAEK